MAYSSALANRIRSRFDQLTGVKEKEMMGGLIIMYKGKMCVGVVGDDLMVRVDKRLHNDLVEKQGARTMDFTNRPMIGYILIDETGIRSKKDFDYWIDLAIAFNKHAKASKKKTKPTKNKT